VRQDLSPAPGQRADPARIVAAAWRVLERSRFRSLKVRQVLVASGSSANVFYQHFPSKAHLLLALLTDEVDRAARHAGALLSESDQPEQQVRAWITQAVAVAYDERLAARARLFADPEVAVAFPGEVERANRVLVAPLAEVIIRGARTGTFTSVDPGADADAVYRLCRGYVVDLLTGMATRPQEEVVALATDFALRALSAPRRTGV
jgi:AcrR family transcriptional regulator